MGKEAEKGRKNRLTGSRACARNYAVKRGGAMGVYVECPDGNKIFSTHDKACKWLSSLDYAPEAEADVEFPISLARVFSDDGVSMWLRNDSLSKQAKNFRPMLDTLGLLC